MAHPGDEANLTNAKAAVNSIVSKLETRFDKFNISEIIKGGSLGHGTAVPGHYDIDLVIYSRDIRPEDVCAQNGFKKWVDLLKVFMEEEFDLSSNASTPGYNNRSVQFPIQYNGVVLAVDVLVSPYWDTPRDFYQFLRGVPKDSRSMFTVSASKWQVAFFRDTENRIKEYIKRAKAWRNEIWRANSHGKPSSYLMSLLVVKAYENSSQSGAMEVTRSLKDLVKRSSFFSLDVYWADGIYKIAEYRDLLPSPPRIIDPANPANNVWESGFRPAGLSSVLVSRIDTIDLSTPI